MILRLEQLLQGQEVQRLLAIAEAIQFIDGKMSNPGTELKHNLQPEPNDPLYAESAQIVRQAIFRHPDIREFCYPTSLATPMLCKYQPGMRYGRHVDAPLLNTQPPIRSDVSCTVFLSSPDSYQGGELSIEIGDQTVRIKGQPGEAVLYPSTTMHQVMPVTQGLRIVSITFLQSAIKNADQRDILFKLASFIHREHQSISEESRMELEYVRFNLTRMWHNS